MQQIGSPTEIYERPANTFVAGFIGSPAMNLLPGQIVTAGEVTTVQLTGGGTISSNVPTTGNDVGLNVNVGVRPEDMIATKGDGAYKGHVNIVEALGEVTVLYFEDAADHDPVIAKLPGIRGDMRGKAVTLTADPAKVHLFADGRSLLYR